MAKKILIAPMDWGLGHTSRCIPIAQYYHNLGHHIFFAGNALQQQLFSASCPFASLLELNGYHIAYPQKGHYFMLKMAAQLPRLQQTIYREQQWLRQQMREHAFDIILADNRYGLHHPDARCILLTHQLHIQTGTFLGNRLVRYKVQQFINRFDACWVPDHEDTPLAGMLSNHLDLKKPLEYIGWLSQFQFKNHIVAHPLAGHAYTLALLSGPEPMRTQLESTLLQQMAALPARQFVMIGGTQQQPASVANNIKYISLADSTTLYGYLQYADSVISRSGYSTVMDVVYMQRPALFVPTPGQTEQEVIARHLRERQWFPYTHQNLLNIAGIAPSKFNAPAFSSRLPEL